jgi:hypothetical protein
MFEKSVQTTQKLKGKAQREKRKKEEELETDF